MEPTINIPNSGGKVHFVDKDYLVSVNEELIEFLCNYVSSYKISQLSAEDKSSLCDQMSLIKNLHKNKFQEVLQIMKCLKCSNRELSVITSCNHGFCSECITSHINEKTMGCILLNDLEASDPQMISTSCPSCNSYLTEEDLRAVYGDLEELKQMAKLRKVNIERNGKSFNCFNCGKVRGSSQFMSKTCGHMCKSCFAQRGCEQLSGTCKVCGQIINEGLCDNNTVRCGKCNGEFFMIGDFMQEVCIGQFFCPNCACDMVEKGICYCHNQPIMYSKKLEVVKSSYRTCIKCEKEKLIGFFIRHKCCESPICFECAKQVQQCPYCNVPFNQRIINSIEDFHLNRHT